MIDYTVSLSHTCGLRCLSQKSTLTEDVTVVDHCMGMGSTPLRPLGARIGCSN